MDPRSNRENRPDISATYARRLRLDVWQAWFEHRG